MSLRHFTQGKTQMLTIVLLFGLCACNSIEGGVTSLNKMNPAGALTDAIDDIRDVKLPHVSIDIFNKIDVTHFGAIPDDGIDDTAAIQKAIDSSQSGDVVFFPSGEYQVSSSLKLASERSYAGDTEAKLMMDSAASGHVMSLERVNDVVIAGLVFYGSGVVVEGRRKSRNVAILENTFHVAHENRAAIDLRSELEGCQILRNHFVNVDGQQISDELSAIRALKRVKSCEIDENFLHNIDQVLSIIKSERDSDSDDDSSDDDDSEDED